MNIKITRTTHSYAAYREGSRVGELTYSRDGNQLTAIHTEVDPAVEGKGVGGALARSLLDDARADGAKVVLQCPFVSSFVARHPEYADLRVT